MGIARLGAALAVALLVAGCGGGGDDGGAGKDIASVAAKALTSKDPTVRCVDTVTKGFVKTVYGSEATCRAAIAKPDPTKPATGAKVADVKVDGDKATADVTTVGGTSAGSHGDMTFAKQDGTWKIDALSVGFLRSRLEVQVAASRDGPFADAGVRRCFTERMGKLGGDEFLAVAYAAIAERAPHPTFLRVLSDCATSVKDSSGVSVMRRQFEDGIRQSATKDKMSGATVECVLQALRRSIPDSEIVRISTERARLTQRVGAAMTSCGATG